MYHRVWSAKFNASKMNNLHQRSNQVSERPFESPRRCSSVSRVAQTEQDLAVSGHGKAATWWSGVVPRWTHPAKSISFQLKRSPAPGLQHPHPLDPQKGAGVPSFSTDCLEEFRLGHSCSLSLLLRSSTFNTS